MARGPLLAPFLPVLVLALVMGGRAYWGGEPDPSLGVVGRVVWGAFLVALPVAWMLLFPGLNTLAVSRLRRRLGSEAPRRLTVLAAFTLASLPLYLEGLLTVYGPLPGLALIRLLPPTLPGTAAFFLNATLGGITPGFLLALGLYWVTLTEVLHLPPRQGAWITGGLAVLDQLVVGLATWSFFTGLHLLLRHWGIDPQY